MSLHQDFPYQFEYIPVWGFAESLRILMKNIYNIEVPIEKRDAVSVNFFHLIGIDSGSFTMFEDVVVKDGTSYYPTNYKAQNHSGFSIVIPAWKIVETLDRDEFVMDRKNREKEAVKIEEGVAGLDFSEAEVPIFTNDVFEDALKKVSRKTSEPVSEKKETSE